MKDEEQRIAIAESQGWERKLYNGSMSWYFNDIQSQKKYVVCRIQDETNPPTDILPNYLKDLNAIYLANKAIGLHDRNNLALRVKWVGHLRDIVARGCPVNKVGSPVVCDLDILCADARELCEAYLLTIGKWKKKK